MAVLEVTLMRERSATGKRVCRSGTLVSVDGCLTFDEVLDHVAGAFGRITVRRTRHQTDPQIARRGHQNDRRVDGSAGIRAEDPVFVVDDVTEEIEPVESERILAENQTIT
jgi:hypothetical protein